MTSCCRSSNACAWVEIERNMPMSNNLMFMNSCKQKRQGWQSQPVPFQEGNYW